MNLLEYFLVFLTGSDLKDPDYFTYLRQKDESEREKARQELGA